MSHAKTLVLDVYGCTSKLCPLTTVVRLIGVGDAELNRTLMTNHIWLKSHGLMRSRGFLGAGLGNMPVSWREFVCHPLHLCI